MNIYIGNIEIAGYFMRLKDGFDKIQVKADLWYLINNKYYKDKSNGLLKFNQRLFTFFKKYKQTKYVVLTIPAVIAMFCIHAMVLIYSLFKYDVFILNSQPFFNYSELAILKLFRKKIIVVFLGTESRPAYISGNLIFGRYKSNDSFNFSRCFKNVKEQVRSIRRIEKYADYIINHPPTALLQAKPFIGWLHIGFPNENVQAVGNDTLVHSTTVKILHAPSNAVSKGSEKIKEIIHRLTQEGLSVEFLKLENVPNDKVVDELNKCDIVVDELYSDIPIGGIGTEAAFAKKPVVNGGYYATGIEADYPAGIIPPACYCLPEALEAELKDLILSPQKREEQANKLHEYVTENWNSVAIANRYMRIINDDVPQEWMYDPYRIQYFYGYGIEKSRLKSFLAQYVEKCGEAALFLDDKPRLKDAMREFIKGSISERL